VARLNRGWVNVDSFLVDGDRVVVRTNVRMITYQRVTDDTVLLQYTRTTTTVERNGAPVGQPVTTSSAWHKWYEDGTSTVDEQGSERIGLSPNPVSGSRITLRGVQGTVGSVHIASIDGATTEEAAWTSSDEGRLDVTLPSLATGTYMMLVTRTDGSVMVRPFTVVR
jgi:hypothetical protein